MTDGLRGADTTALRQQALALHRAGEALTTCAHHTGRELEALRWDGPDARAARDAWQQAHAPILLRCAQGLHEAAVRLLDEADEQDRVSGRAPATSGPDGTDWSALRRTADAAHDAVRDGIAMIGNVGTLADLTVMAQALARWHNLGAGTPYRVLDRAFGVMKDANIGAGLGTVMGGLTAIGIASDLYGAHRAHQAGDLHGMVDNGVSAVFGAGTFVPGLGLGSAALGVSWKIGTGIGTAANDAMQGTDFQRRFADRMDPAFDLGGAWGMLNTPGALIVTGAEEVGIQARNLWRGLTSRFDGTLDGTSGGGG